MSDHMWVIFNIWGKNLKTKEEINIDDLKWIRIFDPIHIPCKYVEQIKDRQFSVNKFYRIQKDACVENVDGQLQLNPTNLLFVLADKGNLVKGFCWMVVDLLCDALVINCFSMDNEYWGSGKCVPILERKAKEIQEGANLKKVYWITRSPKHSEKFGFKRSKHVLMEYIDGPNNHGESGEADGESRPDDSRTEAVS